MIREATVEDIPDLLAMAAQFVGVVGETFNAEHTAHYLAWAMSHGVVIRGEKGAIGGMIQPTPFNENVRYATELFWWSEGGEGVRLLRAYEKWAVENGVNYIVVSTIDTIESGASRILVRRGYEARETKYVRKL